MIGGALAALLLVGLALNYSDADPIICEPGFHLENGICVIDPIPVFCPVNYVVSGNVCQPVIPAPHPSYAVTNTQIRITDRDTNSFDANIISYVPEILPQVRIVYHLHVFNPATNTEVIHETKTITADANDSENRNIAFSNVDPLEQCTVYNLFVYATSPDGTVLYSKDPSIEQAVVMSKGCLTASILSFLRLG